MKKKLRLRREVQDFLGVALFYAVIVLGVIVLNARFESINKCVGEGNTESYCVGER